MYSAFIFFIFFQVKVVFRPVFHLSGLGAIFPSYQQLSGDRLGPTDLWNANLFKFNSLFLKVTHQYLKLILCSEMLRTKVCGFYRQLTSMSTGKDGLHLHFGISGIICSRNIL